MAAVAVDVQIIAVAMVSSGLTIEVSAKLLFQISPNTFLPHGAYSDTAYPRPGFLLYQSPTVPVGIIASISGTVGPSADLLNSFGAFVAHASAIQSVATGTVTVALRFDGDDLYTSQRDGPYTLTNLLVTDQTGAALVTAQSTNVYETAFYQDASFARPHHLYLPAVMR